MKIYLSQTNYNDYNRDNKYPIENIKKQYDIYCKQNMYFNTNDCTLYCNGKWISKYSRYEDMLELKEQLKDKSINELIDYCTRWEFKGFMLSSQDYYMQGGEITGY